MLIVYLIVLAYNIVHTLSHALFSTLSCRKADKCQKVANTKVSELILRTAETFTEVLNLCYYGRFAESYMSEGGFSFLVNC